MSDDHYPIPPRDKWPSWDPFSELTDSLEWLSSLPPNGANGVKRLAAMYAVLATGSDEAYADLLLETDEEEFPETDSDHAEWLWRWYKRGIIIAAGRYRGRAIHTEASLREGYVARPGELNTPPRQQRPHDAGTE